MYAKYHGRPRTCREMEPKEIQFELIRKKLELK